MLKTLISIFFTFFLIVAFPIIGLFSFFLIISETLATSATSITFLSLYFGSAFLLFSIRLDKKLLLKISISLYSLATISAIVSLSLIPSGNINSKIGLRSVYLSDTKPLFCLITKLIREIDQVKLGSILIPYADNLIDQEKGARLRNYISEAYTEMQTDPDFVNVGTVINHAYFDIAGADFSSKHIYVYTPEHKPNEKLPIILFLHGSMGNFKVFTWVMKQFADKYKYAIVAPTHGEGNWDLDNGVDVIENARNFCVDDPNMDGDRIILAGISNGGLGVTRATLENPGYYKGLIYISSILEYDLVTSNEFIMDLNDKPMLVIHGTEDLRIPKPEIDEAVATLNAAGIYPKVEYFEGDDHFLFLSKKDEVLGIMYRWIEGLK